MVGSQGCSARRCGRSRRWPRSRGPRSRRRARGARRALADRGGIARAAARRRASSACAGRGRWAGPRPWRREPAKKASHSSLAPAAWAAAEGADQGLGLRAPLAQGRDHCGGPRSSSAGTRAPSRRGPGRGRAPRRRWRRWARKAGTHRQSAPAHGRGRPSRRGRWPARGLAAHRSDWRSIGIWGGLSQGGGRTPKGSSIGSISGE